MPEEDIGESIPVGEAFDRPLECGQCRKAIKVIYTEITSELHQTLAMCEDCPQLQQRLKGAGSRGAPSALTEATAGLCCGNCGTSLEAVQMGQPLGCNECYTVFADLILKELIKAGKIPARLAEQGKSKKHVPLHVGRGPGEAVELSPSIKLLALNEALAETLDREDYEQAAWIRDQIKALTEESEGESKKEK